MANWYDCGRCGKQYEDTGDGHECADVIALQREVDMLKAMIQAGTNAMIERDALKGYCHKLSEAVELAIAYLEGCRAPRASGIYMVNRMRHISGINKKGKTKGGAITEKWVEWIPNWRK